MQTRASGSIAKSSSAPSNLNPPRLTNLAARLLISICTCGGKNVPALSARAASTKTSPARIMAWALARDSARPRSTSRASSRMEVDFAVIARDERLGSANNQILGDFAQADRGFTVGSKLRDGLAGQIIRNFVGTLQSVDRGIGGFLLGDVFSRGLAERGGGFFHVQNVVGDLKSPADGFAEAAEARHVVGARAGTQCSGSDRSANQRGGFRTVNVFEHFRFDALPLGFQLGDLATDHAVDSARGAGDFFHYGDTLSGRDGRRADGFEREGQQRVSGQDGDGFAEFLVAGRLAAAQVVVVECRQVVVDQRIGVNHFDGAGGMQPGGDVGGKDSRRFEAQNGTDWI